MQPTREPSARPTPWPTQVPTPSPTPDPTPVPTTLAPTPAPTVPRPLCNICQGVPPLVSPPGFISNGIMFDFMGVPVTCGQAQLNAFQFGSTLGVTEEQCSFLQVAARGVCGCPNDPFSSPSPTEAPANAIVPTEAPTPEPTVFCVLCLSGYTDPLPGNMNFIANVDCRAAQVMGERSELTQRECAGAQLLADSTSDPCMCRELAGM